MHFLILQRVISNLAVLQSCACTFIFHQKLKEYSYLLALFKVRKTNEYNQNIGIIWQSTLIFLLKYFARDFSPSPCSQTTNVGVMIFFLSSLRSFLSPLPACLPLSTSYLSLCVPYCLMHIREPRRLWRNITQGSVLGNMYSLTFMGHRNCAILGALQLNRRSFGKGYQRLTKLFRLLKRRQ